MATLCEVLAARSGEYVLRDSDQERRRNFNLYHSNVDNVDDAKITQLVTIARALHPPQSSQSLSLKARCGLAACAALAVLHLSKSPWLGDDWDGSRIGIFLEKPKNNAERLADRPCFLYDYFPLSLTVPGDEDDLVHDASSGPTPNAVDHDSYDKFATPNITVFSLGVLLVELCLGVSFAQVREDWLQRQQQQTQQPGHVSTPAPTFSRRQFALSNLEEVYKLAGDSYGDAAKRCIRFSFPGRDSHNNFDMEQFRRTFYQDVVAPVHAAYRSFP